MIAAGVNGDSTRLRSFAVTDKSAQRFYTLSPEFRFVEVPKAHARDNIKQLCQAFSIPRSIIFPSSERGLTGAPSSGAQRDFGDLQQADGGQVNRGGQTCFFCINGNFIGEHTETILNANNGTMPGNGACT